MKKRHTTPEAVTATKKEKSKRYREKGTRKIIEQSEIPAKNPEKQVVKQPEKKLNKGGRP